MSLIIRSMEQSNNGIGHFMEKAEYNGFYNVESEKRGIGYVFDSGEIAIVTSRGYMRMDEETARCLARELNGILDDVKDLKRVGVRI